jgi:hypothetical protein
MGNPERAHLRGALRCGRKGIWGLSVSLQGSSVKGTWRGTPCWGPLGSSTLRQARELISGPRRSNRAGLLSLNRIQSRVVTGFLTGHNTLRRHLILQGLADSPVGRGVA